MALQHPSWRLKTQPCRFYQQEKCLFADSCNFLHTLTVDGSPETTLVELSQRTYAPITPSVVKVDSPRSVRSPTRSPRLSGLLLALKDVIGEDDVVLDEDSETFLNESDMPKDPDTPSKVSDEAWEGQADTSGSTSVIDQYATPDDQDTVRLSPPSEHEKDNRQQPTPRTIQTSSDLDHTTPVSNTADQNPAVDDLTPDLLSPVDSFSFSLASFGRLAGQRDSSFDSGYAETDKWISPCPLVLSPPRSPSLSSTHDPLSSPIIPTPPCSLESAVSSPKTDIIDVDDKPLAPSFEQEGTPSSWPQPRAEEPNYASASHDQVHADDDDDEDFTEEYDFGSSFSGWDVSENEPTAVFLGDPKTPELSSGDESGHVSSREQSSPSRATSDIPENESTAAFVEDARDDVSSALLAGWPVLDELPNSSGDNNHGSEVGHIPSISTPEVQAALRRSLSSPVHLLTSGSVDFVDGEMDANSSLASATSGLDNPAVIIPSSPSLTTPSDDSSEPDTPSDFNEDDLLNSSTVRLELVPDQSLVPTEKDSLQSLYDVYSAFPTSEQNNHAALVDLSIEMTAKTPTRASFTRERVFTPPVGRSRSGTVTANLSNSEPLSMAVTSFPTQGRSTETTPQSAQLKGKGLARSSEGAVRELVTSKKVPFGFRHSSTSGVARSPSLAADGIARVTPSPLLRTQSARSPSTEQLSVSPEQSLFSPPMAGLKPLTLSTVLNRNSYELSSPLSRSSSSPLNSYHHFEHTQHASISSASVSPNNSLSKFPLLSSTGALLTPEHRRTTLGSSHVEYPSSISSIFSPRRSHHHKPHSAPVPQPQSWIMASRHTARDVDDHPVSFQMSEPQFGHDPYEDSTNGDHSYDDTVRRAILASPQTAPVSYASTMRSPSFSISSPRPTLLFAIASDDVEQVRQVLKNGSAGPNDTVGPQSALAFTLTNDQLRHKLDIIKTLLAFGADPAELKQPKSNSPYSKSESEEQTDTSYSPTASLLDTMDSATRYYVARAQAPHTRRMSALIFRSFFRPLTHALYEFVGQDCALEQLFRVLNMHTQQITVTPIVVLLCGPSGHGKSLLAGKFGSLLDVPTHTVNMTTLRSSHDLWKSYSIGLSDESTACTLAEFLIRNDGKRCVVVLDEIEKTQKEMTLWPLLMPWELGRCSFDANTRFIDVRNVIWLGSSNIGQDLILEFQKSRHLSDEPMTREHYVELMSLLRPRISEHLGASVLSRVTAVLPFVPFNLEEQRAIIAEALHSLGGELLRTLSSQAMETLVSGALASYSPAEGARSLFRAVSNQLVDTM